MENASYTTLTRQSGLLREMQVIANNIANTATTGFRQEGIVFSEFVHAEPGMSSVSMALANVGATSPVQGALEQTGNPFDVAIEGDGYFTVETPEGLRLTRAGSFSPSAVGDLVTPEGYRVLDAGAAPIFIPPDAADVTIAADGTISSDGRPLAQIAVVVPVEGARLTRHSGTLMESDLGVEPLDTPRVMQRFVENSNVDPIGQIARMITVQRAYELGQSFLDAEDQRIRAAVKSLTE